MKKLLTFLVMAVLAVNLLSGCADQAKAPGVLDNAGTSTAAEDTSADPAAGLTAENAVESEDKAAAGDESQQEGETAAAGESVTDETTAAAATPVAETAADAAPAPFSQLATPVPGDKIAIIETDLGTIKFKLFPDRAPEISKNFEELAAANMFNAVPFHRVVENFMIQTGDFSAKNGTGGYSYKGPGTTLADEITPDLKHLYGAVSMANRGPDTNGSQFFIVTNPEGTAFLDGGYSVFGQVYEGMDVALKIAALQVPGTEKPSQTVNMTNVEVMTVQ